MLAFIVLMRYDSKEKIIAARILLALSSPSWLHRAVISRVGLHWFCDFIVMWLFVSLCS